MFSLEMIRLFPPVKWLITKHFFLCNVGCRLRHFSDNHVWFVLVEAATLRAVVYNSEAFIVTIHDRSVIQGSWESKAAALLCSCRIRWSWGSQPCRGRCRWCRCSSTRGPTPLLNRSRLCYSRRRASLCRTTHSLSCGAKIGWRMQRVLPLRSFEWLLLSLENIFGGSQHWPVVWHSEPSHGDVITFGAKLQQQEEVGHEGGGEGELSSGHQTQFVPLHQQPAEEDPHRHRWQVQYTWRKRVRMFRHGEVSAAESLSLHTEVFCFSERYWMKNRCHNGFLNRWVKSLCGFLGHTRTQTVLCCFYCT